MQSEFVDYLNINKIDYLFLTNNLQKSLKMLWKSTR